MKIKFSFFREEIEEEKERIKYFEALWGDNFLENKEALRAGIATGLNPIVSQLKSILQREWIEVEGIGFDVGLEWLDKTDILCVRYLFSTHSLWFKLSKGASDDDTISFHDIHNLSTKEDIREYGEYKARIITSDVAREGISKTMKSVIGDIKRGVSYLDPLVNFDEVD